MENNQQTLKSSMKTRHVVFRWCHWYVPIRRFIECHSGCRPIGYISVFIGGTGFICRHLRCGADRPSSKDQFAGHVSIVSPYLGERFDHFTDWVYWADSMAVMVAEAAAIAQLLHVWWPQVPKLSICLGRCNLDAWNQSLFRSCLCGDRILTDFIEGAGRYPFNRHWLLVLMVQVFHLGFQSGLSHMNQHGGFMPNGYKGIFNAMLMVINSYGGSELIAITVSEVKNPKEAIPKAIRGVMSRIIAFYVIPMFLFLELFSWQFLSATKASSFAGDLINLVIILALFSVINSMIYATSRSLYARVQGSKHGFGRYLSQLSKRQAPVRAIAFCAGVLFVGVVLSYIFGNALFDIMAAQFHIRF